MTTAVNTLDQTSILKELRDRRVPQIFGIYLGGSWAVIQFVDWLVNRYYLSHHLTDLVLTVLLSMTPSILILAFFHGRPGGDSWTKFEKIGIPINVAIAFFLVFGMFGDKKFGKSAQKITVTDEDGHEFVRTIPQKDYLKKVAIFHFDSESSDSAIQLQAWGLPLMLSSDLSQDSFFIIQTPFNTSPLDGNFFMEKELKDAGFEDGKDVPLQLQAKIAQNQFCPFLVRGSMSKTEKGLMATYQIHHSGNQKLKLQGQVEGEDYFQIIDKLSLEIKGAFELPKAHLENVPDLPIRDLMTREAGAIENYLTGYKQLKGKNLEAAIKAFEAAIALDSSFVHCYPMLQFVYLTNNQIEERFALYKPLMKNIFKLPERDQYFVKADYYIAKQEGEKAFAVLEMVTQLYPQDINGWAMLALFQTMRNELRPALETYAHLMEMDPSAYNIWVTTAKLHQQLGEYDQSRKLLQKYLDEFPDKVDAHENMGDLALAQGEFPEAKAYFEKALLLEPENIAILLKTGEVAAKTGEFQVTYEVLDEALRLSDSPAERHQVLARKEALHRLRGELKQALATSKRKEDESRKYEKPFFSNLGRLGSLELYVEAGQVEHARTILKEISDQLVAPYDQFISIGEISLYSAIEEEGSLQEAVVKLDTLINAFKNEFLRPNYFQGQAKVYKLQGRFDLALEQYRKHQSIAQESPGLYRQVGHCLRELGKLEEAEKVLEKSLALQPYEPRSRLEMARIKHLLGKTTEAESHLDKALEIWKNADPEFKPAASARELKESWRNLG